MRIGILADIHEAVDPLGRALERVRRKSVDRMVLLGDICNTGEHLPQTIRLLQAAGAAGVWGNHDAGLCVDSEAPIRDRYDPAVVEFMARLRPSLELEECLFTHGLPFWDPTDPFIYYLGDEPESPTGRATCFAASPHRVMFIGHFHRWLVATPRGRLSWHGEDPIALPYNERYFVVVAAVCDGYCAVFDTDTRLLTPLRL